MSNFELLRRKLSHDKIDEVISSLLEIEDSDTEIKNSIILASSEWHDWKKREMGGLCPSNEFKLKIIFRLLQIISFIEGQSLNGSDKEKVKTIEQLEKNLKEIFEKVGQIKDEIKETTDSQLLRKLNEEATVQKDNYMALLKTYEKVITLTFLGVGSFFIFKDVISDSAHHNDSIFSFNTFTNESAYPPDHAEEHDYTANENEDDHHDQSSHFDFDHPFEA